MKAGAVRMTRFTDGETGARVSQLEVTAQWQVVYKWRSWDFHPNALAPRSLLLTNDENELSADLD